MLLFKNASLGIILALLVLVLCDDDEKDKEEEEEKDPWDKSTDKYRHKLGSTGVGSHEEEPVKIDVTEVSESEVHSERSKVCKNCKPAKLRARTHAPQPKSILNATKLRKKTDAQDFTKNDVDAETKEQIDDATDEQDPAADAKVRETKVAAKDKKTSSKKKAGVASKISHKGKSVSEIGSSWDTPCYYNSDTNKFSCKQLIPAHYYGPPSAGWGGFQPGQTGGGWGTPHWNKKCHTPEAKCRTYYKVPSTSKMFVGKGGSWDSDTYRYSGVQYPESPAIRFRASRPEETINRIAPIVTNPKIYGSQNNIAALHEWIKFLQNEREKDRMLERFRLEMKDKESQRRYNLMVIRYKQAQAQVTERSRLSQLGTGRSIAPHVDSRQIKYYSKPQLQEQAYEKKAVQYVLSRNGMPTPLYNDK